MAFVNEHMTKEEMADFAAKAIKNPGNRLMTLKPYRWTIDREKNIFLLWALQEREEPHDKYFLLGWEGIYVPVKLRDLWVKGSPRTWELIYIKIPEELKEKQSEIIQSLKDALAVYGFNGNPNEPFNAMNQKTSVEFNF